MKIIKCLLIHIKKNHYDGEKKIFRDFCFNEDILFSAAISLNCFKCSNWMRSCRCNWILPLYPFHHNFKCIKCICVCCPSRFFSFVSFFVLAIPILNGLLISLSFKIWKPGSLSSLSIHCWKSPALNPNWS